MGNGEFRLIADLLPQASEAALDCIQKNTLH
jgi:hypothetical protein